MEPTGVTGCSPNGHDALGDPSEQFDCPICQDVLKTPIRTKACQHVFCKSCFVAAVRARGPTCPMCRGPVSEDEKRASDVQRKMKETRGNCRACGAPDFLSKMRTHYKYCQKYKDEYGLLVQPCIITRNQAQVPPTYRAPAEVATGRTPSIGGSPQAEYSCPYCPLQGFQDMALVRHCLSTHSLEHSLVVCPICACTSWGDRSYCSRNFIGHLRARHRFSYDIYMNVHEDEDVQVRLATQQSLLQGIPVPPILSNRATVTSVGEMPAVTSDPLRTVLPLCNRCLQKVQKYRHNGDLYRGDACGDVRPATYRATARAAMVQDIKAPQLGQRRLSRLQLDGSQGTAAQGHWVVGPDDGSRPTSIPPNTPNPAPSGSAAGQASPQVQANLQNQAQAPATDDNDPRTSLERVFSCPYCQDGGLDELDLLDHCNINHRHETRPVVCPICVALPHGDPSYYSRDLIGHLNLRHCFYIADYTNVDQTDEMNCQAGLLESYKQWRESQQ
ncbi:uncharacterized protein LOC125739791 [Brienomyrus brachyistius]|uniref:uncharacterized protein LOC125739791 n=1 Tax=Brienomyrus brachyistius TaxID=42636 RepID=UPI0020B1A4F4|nr:uncharacterized protein LOC125739791 [Brienomyrus brachyistius]